MIENIVNMIVAICYTMMIWVYMAFLFVGAIIELMLGMLFLFTIMLSPVIAFVIVFWFITMILTMNDEN